jgi:hypothetical protein
MEGVQGRHVRWGGSAAFLDVKFADEGMVADVSQLHHRVMNAHTLQALLFT